MFVDASEKSYAAAVYLISRSPGNHDSDLISSKSRLSPVRGLSIPRLELPALLIGIRAMRYVVKELKIPVTRRVIWYDSKSVLHWLKTSKILPVFITNRLKEIKEVKDVEPR